MSERTPAAFVDEVRNKVREIAGRNALVVVEGKHDKIAIMPFLHSSSIVLVADGKDKLLAAYDSVEPFLRDALLFVMDCDGGTEDRYKGHIDLVLTTNRDIEADVILRLDPAKRAGPEIYGPYAESGEDAVNRMQTCIDSAAAFSALVGVTLKAAHQLSLKSSVLDRGQKRRIEVLDIVAPDDVAYLGQISQIGEVVSLIANLLSWSMEDREQVIALALQDAESECRRHRFVSCITCVIQRSSNGHHFVQAIAAIVSDDIGIPSDTQRIGSILRTSTVVSPLVPWPTLHRIARWQELSEYMVLKDSFRSSAGGSSPSSGGVAASG